MNKIVLLFVVVLMCAGVANAQSLIVSDDFSYTDGSLLTANGWTAHSGAGTQAITVTSGGGLTYTGYTNSGVGNAALVDNNGEDVSLVFSSAITSGTMYYSCLVNVRTAVSGYFLHLGGSASAFAARVHVKPSSTSGKVNFWISNRSSDAVPSGGTDFDDSTTYLIIVKYDVSSTGACSLWVKSSGVPGDESSAGAPEDTSINTGQASIDRICLRQYNATQNYIVDGIRVADDWTFAPLPVELTSFNAVTKGRSVELVWKTATEVNNHGFEIQRRAASDRHLEGDGHFAWAKIGFVAGAGNSNAPKEYSYTDKVPVSGKYLYRLKQVDNDGAFEYSSSVEVQASALAKGYELAQNHPNPFNPTTNIAFALANDEFVSLKVYDMLGKEIATLVNGKQSAGAYTVPFNASSYPSGIYFYTLRTGNSVETKKMSLIK